METKELTKHTYSTGYFYHEVNRYFKYEEDCFYLYGDGIFNYKDCIKQPCYDINGKYLGVFESEERYTKKEKDKLLNSDWTNGVLQLNYNFYKIEYGANTMDEVSNFERILENSNLIKVNDWDSNCRFDANEIYNQFNTGKIKDKYEPFDLIEICYSGNSQRITNIVNKKIYELDIKDYTKRKNLFIKQNPDLKTQTERVYIHNIVYLMDFWKLNKNQLNSFNIVDKTINKLNRKITSKIT
jgi:hypothetical protein